MNSGMSTSVGAREQGFEPAWPAVGGGPRQRPAAALPHVSRCPSAPAGTAARQLLAPTGSSGSSALTGSSPASGSSYSSLTASSPSAAVPPPAVSPASSGSSAASRSASA